jgi:protein-L-isoaspartate(D-aspartate) O-methyltransferase
LIAVLAVGACDRRTSDDDFARQRESMVQRTVVARGVKDPRVLAAMRKVPRHELVPKPSRKYAYVDRPLPIGWGQTISQPYVVAAMTEAALPKATDRCLEIGTGSGYQAAVLAELCAKVFSIEIVPELARFAKDNLRRLGYGPDKVQLFTGDGYKGWPEEAPFQVIIVTAAPPKAPRVLLDQLAERGRLVVPVGPEGGVQTLERWTRVKPGQGVDAFAKEELMNVRFVPMVSER